MSYSTLVLLLIMSIMYTSTSACPIYYLIDGMMEYAIFIKWFYRIGSAILIYLLLFVIKYLLVVTKKNRLAFNLTKDLSFSH